MTNKKRKNKERFPRREEVVERKAWGDRRWRNAAKQDLAELIDDEEGIDRLADAIRAILRAKT